MRWIEALGQVEELEDATLDAGLVAEFEAASARSGPRPIRFSTPTFRDYTST